MTSKDRSIAQLLATLDLDRRDWKIVDHWEADTCAIGIGMVTEPRRLVYISTFEKETDRYDFECELPSGPAETDYEVTDRGEDVSYEQLLKVIEKHLS